ncbi:MAG: hypothetical protein IT493_03055 [Gammaproteobacteria bacterium]|nr:hypothetical protein [Gammaproteobacteria bacterium]
MKSIRIGTVITLACLGAAVFGALVLAREHARQQARGSMQRRQIEDWESEGGALATQPQVPGTVASAPPESASAAV